MSHFSPIAGVAGDPRQIKVSWILGGVGAIGRAVEIRDADELTLTVDGAEGAVVFDASFDGHKFGPITKRIPVGESACVKNPRQRFLRPRQVSGADGLVVRVTGRRP